MNAARSGSAAGFTGLDGASLWLPTLSPRPFSIGAIEPSPCARACPAGINVKSYVSLIAEGRFAEALEVVRERCPLPAICGRICHRPCEAACRRGDIDEPVAIRALKRFVADLELGRSAPPPPAEADKTDRVAIVGSGPAGLTAAYDLRRAGYPVTVFEAAPEPGGMLRYGIADYRLPPAVLDAEIEILEERGVEIRTDTRIGSERDLEELLSGGFAAVLFAVGAQRGRGLGVAGESDSPEVEDALSFLRRVNGGDHAPVNGRVLVIGGGSTAIETARVARRLDARSVTVVYRRDRGEMPADREEIEVAEEEGVELRLLAAPARVVASGSRLQGLECLEVALGEPDRSGRRQPMPIAATEFVLPAERIFAAVGQEAVLDFLPPALAPRVAERGRIRVDPDTAMSALHGIFAAGDVVSGPATVIEAIASGHRAAAGMRRFLEQGRGGGAFGAGPPAAEREFEIPAPPPPRAERRHPGRVGMVAGEEFAEVELAFTPTAARAEARRCLRCGPCSECLICAPSCGRRHLTLRRGDAARAGGGAGLLLRVPVAVATGLEGGIDGAGGLLQPVPSPPAGSRLETPDAWTVEVVPSRVTIDSLSCRGCARCMEVCAFDAIRLVDPQASETTARVEASRCRGCNLCVAVCPTGAAEAASVAAGWLGVSLADLYAALAPPPARGPLLVLACQRRLAAARAALDRDGLRSPEAHLVPIRCAGQIDAGALLELYRHGAGSFLVAGCLPGSCRYGLGPQLAAEQLLRLRRLLAIVGADADCATADWAGEDGEGARELRLPVGSDRSRPGRRSTRGAED